jgi:hypothetical protein
MASRFTLKPYGAEFPATNFPALLLVNRRPVLAFDASTDETCYWTDILPQGWTGAITIVITYMMASATTGAVRFQAAMEAVSDGDSVDLDSATSIDTANSAGVTVPGTAGFIDQVSITMTNHDSSAAGDYVRFVLNRDADGTSGTDDATGDCYVLAVEARDAA